MSGVIGANHTSGPAHPDLELVHTAVGEVTGVWKPLDGHGYTRSRAWRVETTDGPVFVKQAEDEGSLSMLRRESVVHRGVAGPFLPSLVGFADSGDRAVLAVELLEGASWPPTPRMSARCSTPSSSSPPPRPRSCLRTGRGGPAGNASRPIPSRSSVSGSARASGSTPAWER